jgi:hypothetical protein
LLEAGKDVRRGVDKEWLMGTMYSCTAGMTANVLQQRVLAMVDSN